MCGYHRQSLLSQQSSRIPEGDLTAIDARLAELRHRTLSTAYEKQKWSLETELKDFLASLPAPKTLFTATPLDICRFLVSKDKGGKTQVHLSSCPHLGLHGVKSCACAVRLSYKSVDSFIGKLRAIFKSAGRDGNWDVVLGLGNPAASLEVQRYHKAFTSEKL